ncbi:MAG: TonB family protein [Pyrinomonadaceae bacterium]
MFDRLIESEPEGADFKNRRSYFMVSALVVGVFFATAVVVSIYAAEVGLGNTSFELVEMIAPPDTTPPEPETPQPAQPRTETRSQSAVATRQVKMARVEESPRLIPSEVSTTQNTQKARPQFGRYEIGKFDTEPVGAPTGVRNASEAPSGGLAQARSQQVAAVERETVSPPPVVKRDPPPNKPVSKGVLNGTATSLPKPAYSAAAKAVSAQGRVNVQVMIDESGKVISANAVSGHVLLRSAAEDAARRARFTPTLLSDIPVKVTGVITYNFTR